MNEDENNDSQLTYPIEARTAKLALFMEKVFSEWTERNVVFTITNPQEDENGKKEFEMAHGNERVLASPEYFLPLFFYSSIETCNDVLKKQLPVHFYAEENSLLKWVPSIYEDNNNSLFLWTHLLDHSVEKMIKEQHPDYKKRIKKNEKIKVSLDGLHKKWHENVLEPQHPKVINIKNAADILRANKNKISM